MARVLIIDDEEIIRYTFSEGLKDFGHEVKLGSTIDQAMDIVENSTLDICFIDLKLAGESGLDLLEAINSYDKDIVNVIMTAYGDVDSAVSAMKLGAFDYISKPFDLEEVDLLISKAMETIGLKNKLDLYEKTISLQEAPSSPLLGKSQAIRETKEKIDLISQIDDITVLITGSTGTGKGLVADEIHKKSSRSKSNMLKINCSTIPEGLMESEFFGYEKNSFTGANKRKKGLMEIAHGGMVFLDEIGDMKANMQVKLLSFLEDKTFRRIGGLEDIKVDVQVLAATNKDLKDQVDRGEFREDLYYRLNVVSIELKDLKDREEDSLLLAEYFLDQYKKKYKKERLYLSQTAKDTILEYSWPGNVRELKNIIERAVLLSGKDHIGAEDLSIRQDQNQYMSRQLKDLDNFSLDDEVAKLEQKYIKKAMDQSGGNMT